MGGWAVYSGDVGDGVGTRSGGWMGCVQWGCGRWGGHEIWWVDGLFTLGMWEVRWARELVGGWAVYIGDVGDEVGTRTGGWMDCVQW